MRTINPREEPAEVIALRIPSRLAAEIRRQAAADDRNLSSFLRRRLAAAFGMAWLYELPAAEGGADRERMP